MYATTFFMLSIHYSSGEAESIMRLALFILSSLSHSRRIAMNSWKFLAASARSSADQVTTASSGLLSLQIISPYTDFHLYPLPEPWTSFLPEGKALQPV